MTPTSRPNRRMSRGALAGIIVMLCAVVVIVINVLFVRSGGGSSTAATSTVPAGIAGNDPLLALGRRDRNGRLPRRGPAGSAPVSGVAMPRGNLPGFREVFADDFPAAEDVGPDGFGDCLWHGSINASTCTAAPSALNARWWAYSAGARDTSGHGTYEPGRVLTVSGHMLRFRMSTDSLIGPVVAALEPKVQDVDGSAIRFGAYAIRYRASRAPGYEMDFVLFPNDNSDWPRWGAIGFPAGELNGDVSGVLHWYGASTPSAQSVFRRPVSSGWNTAVVEWSPGRVIDILDGAVVGVDYLHVPENPLHLVLQTQTDILGPAPAPSTVGNVDVAWVVEYAAR